MKSLAPTSFLVAILTAAVGFVACGANTSSGTAVGTAGQAASVSGSGGTGSTSAGSSHSGGTVTDLSCPSAECGPALGIPSTTCADGSIGGPTGRCLRLETGGCAWERRTCPPAGEGGAAAAGGASASAGAAAASAGEGGAAGAGGAPATDRCGGCAPNGPVAPICIYQAGGPGPGRFVCAKRTACRSASACACIVEQGSCNAMLEGGSPSYCVCDNGLE